MLSRPLGSREITSLFSRTSSHRLMYWVQFLLVQSTLSAFCLDPRPNLPWHDIGGGVREVVIVCSVGVSGACLTVGVEAFGLIKLD